MTVETTEDTKSKKKNKAAKKAETVTLEAGVFPFEFLPVKADNDLIHVDPRTLIQAPFDSRAADTAPDEDLVKSIKDQGVLQPVVVTPVRDRTTGETGYMLIAGRLRTKGSIINGLETIPAHVKEFTLIEAKYACYTENSARRSTSFWDRAMFFRDMRDNEGIKQQDIAAREIGRAHV